MVRLSAKELILSVLVRSALCLSVLTACATPHGHTETGITVAGGLDISPQRYQDAANTGRVGSVTGRSYEERRKPEGTDAPLADIVVTLFPRSEQVLSELGALKREARSSLQGYHEAAMKIRHRLEAYEAALRAAGAAEVVRTTKVNADGTFRLHGVPTGQWFLYASRSVFIPTRGTSPNPRHQKTFQLPPPPRGYSAITVWLHELVVVDGAVQAVELTDRNPWFTGVIEERGPGPGRAGRGRHGTPKPGNSPQSQPD